MAHIELADVAVAYEVNNERTWALAAADLAVEKGEFVTLVGPSGCGKTTILNLVAGFLRPTFGVVSVNGSPVTGPGPDRGVVFQNYNILPWMTVLKNVELGPRIKGANRRSSADAARKYLELVGLERSANMYPYQLSGGMQQRVAVARALANEPEILLMDEPFAALDALTRADLQEDLAKIAAAADRTVIFVTHSLEEAAFLGSHVVIMGSNPGRIRATMRQDISGARRWSDVRSDPQFIDTLQNLGKAMSRPTVAESA